LAKLAKLEPAKLEDGYRKLQKNNTRLEKEIEQATERQTALEASIKAANKQLNSVSLLKERWNTSKGDVKTALLGLEKQAHVILGKADQIGGQAGGTADADTATKHEELGDDDQEEVEEEGTFSDLDLEAEGFFDP
jgi:DNA gyrase/topoisomerase IV subunit A